VASCEEAHLRIQHTPEESADHQGRLLIFIVPTWSLSSSLKE